MKRTTTLLALVLILATVVPTFAQGSHLQVPDAESNRIAAEKSESGVYIVRMLEDPVVAYAGGIPGLKATKPLKGKKINPNSPHVVAYVDYLTAGHDQALAAVGAQGNKLYSYKYSFNGFAAKLAPGQVEALKGQPGIVNVWADELYQVDTVRTPEFLGLTAEDGLWDMGTTGEDVIVGIIDSGIWPENPSFSDRTGVGPNGQEGKLDYRQIPGWHGKCTPGEDFPASDCNQKLIGAQWYNSGWGGDDGIRVTFPYEYISTRDADGHGSHTASTAAGNYGVNAVVNGIDLGIISGMAHRARIAAYKVCWGVNEGGCFGSDSVAAIDQAVADGVDVLNFSISGTRTNYLDAVEVAFLFAADAGVFVAASAGNSGPGAGTVAHMSPWLTTVAAGTKDDFYAGTVTLGNGAVYEGASRATPVGPAALVYSADVGLAGEDPTQVRLCYPGTLDPAMVSGKIVACDRGTIARVDKSLAVYQAGGIGSILMNTGPSSLNADLHSVPTVHVDHNARTDIIAYIAAEGAAATASLDGNNLQEVEAPFVASFSSRGPNQAGGDLLKPDILAPGVDILAAVSPFGYNGDNFNFLSGTSMSGPHIAGLGALLIDAHPDWSPMMVKSALMTTASTMTNEGNPIPGGPFAYGAGHVVPNSAVDPGLVYDAGFIDWLGFLCGTGQLQASYCPAIGIDPSDLNYPSIAIGELAGTQTVYRTVTNVGPAGTYNVSVSAPAGVDVVVSPASLTLASGESASYSVTFNTTASATIGAYTDGSLTWSDGVRNVTSPLVVKPVQLAAPTELGSTGTDGSLSFDVTFGYNGDYTAAPHGLEPATQTDDNVADDPANDINAALGTCDFGSFPFVCTGITWHVVSVPAGTAYTRISLFDDYTDGADDLDLYVWDAGFSSVGSSGSGTSAEEVNILLPASPFYYVAVHGWQTDGPDANYTLFDWSVSATPGGSLVIDSAPASATLGSTEAIDLSWTGLAAGNKYLGAVSHSDAGGLFGLTLINVSTD
jgi:subtilisin family serine protease